MEQKKKGMQENVNRILKKCPNENCEYGWVEEQDTVTGEWESCRCTDCRGADFDEPDIDDKEECYISVYKLTQRYGGAEEGGWYYPHMELIRTLPIIYGDRHEMFDRLIKQYEPSHRGDIYSVNGGSWIRVYVEEEAGESQTTEVPHYE